MEMWRLSRLKSYRQQTSSLDRASALLAKAMQN